MCRMTAVPAQAVCVCVARLPVPHLTCRQTGSGCRAQRQAHYRGAHTERGMRRQEEGGGCSCLVTVCTTQHSLGVVLHACLLTREAANNLLLLLLLWRPAHSRAHHGACGVLGHVSRGGCGRVQACGRGRRRGGGRTHSQSSTQHTRVACVDTWAKHREHQARQACWNSNTLARPACMHHVDRCHKTVSHTHLAGTCWA